MRVDNKGALGGAQKELLQQGLEKMQLDLPDAALDAIELHLSLVQKWRLKMNLVSISDERELITHHALDSLALLPWIESGQQILDLGTGAGFPGMLLAAARPDARFCLLDSRQRRIEFLRMVNARMQLSNASFACLRVEDWPHSGVHDEQKFDTLVARAVATLEQLLLMTAPLRIAGQRLLAMKGQYPQAELAVLENQYADQLRSIRVEPLDVPFLDAERHVVIIEFQ